MQEQLPTTAEMQEVEQRREQLPSRASVKHAGYYLKGREPRPIERACLPRAPHQPGHSSKLRT